MSVTMEDVKDRENETKRREKNGIQTESGSKKDIVAAWRQQHPDGRKIDCIKDTGLDMNTVRKWWGEPNKINTNKSGKPLGRRILQDEVTVWRRQHPEGRKIDCHRDTGINPKTVRKWWGQP